MGVNIRKRFLDSRATRTRTGRYAVAAIWA